MLLNCDSTDSEHFFCSSTIDFEGGTGSGSFSLRTVNPNSALYVRTFSEVLLWSIFLCILAERDRDREPSSIFWSLMLWNILLHSTVHFYFWCVLHSKMNMHECLHSQRTSACCVHPGIGGIYGPWYSCSAITRAVSRDTTVHQISSIPYYRLRL